MPEQEGFVTGKAEGAARKKFQGKCSALAIIFISRLNAKIYYFLFLLLFVD